MQAVSNSSVLIALAQLKSLSILKRKFAEVYVPFAVWHEVVVGGAERPGSDEVSRASW